MARQSKYRPQQTVLRDAGCDMMELASETYEGLGAEDREKVDTICAELSASLVAKRGSKQTGLGEAGVRELVLALYFSVAYPARSVDESLQRAVV